MRSKKTTYLLLFLTFMFILTVIVLCLIPVTTKNRRSSYGRFHGSSTESMTSVEPSSSTESSTKSSTRTSTDSSTTSYPMTEYKPINISYEDTFLPWKNGACDTSDCRKLAATMMDTMDHSIEACKNFYDYACAGVEDSASLLAKSQKEAINSMHKKYLMKEKTEPSMFFKTCVEKLHPMENQRMMQSIKTYIQTSSLLKLKSPKELEIALLKIDFAPMYDLTVELRDDYDTLVPTFKFPSDGSNFLKISDEEKYCMKEFDQKVEDNRNENDYVLNLNEDYSKYQNCVITDGIDHKISQLKLLSKKYDLLSVLKIEDKDHEKLFSNLKHFFQKKKEFRRQTLTSSSHPEYVKSFEGPLEVFAGIIWKVTGTKLVKNSMVKMYHKNILSEYKKSFTYWDERSLVNLLRFLWAEELLRRLNEDGATSSEFCLETTRHLFPESVQISFIESIGRNEKDLLYNQIHHLGKIVVEELVETTNFTNDNITVHSGSLDEQFLLHKMKTSKLSKVSLESNFIETLQLLYERRRRLNYDLLSSDEQNIRDSIFLLPTDKQPTALFFGSQMVLPLEALVPPMWYFREDLPYYLRMSGVTRFVIKSLLQKDAEINQDENIGEEVLLELEGKDSKTCYANETFKDLRMTGKHNMNATFEIKPESIAKQLNQELQVHNLTWQILKKLGTPIYTKRSSFWPKNDFLSPLIWFKNSKMIPLKAFFIQQAQMECKTAKQFDLKNLIQNEQLPSRIKLDLLAKFESSFSNVFQCSKGVELFTEIVTCNDGNSEEEYEYFQLPVEEN